MHDSNYVAANRHVKTKTKMKKIIFETNNSSQDVYVFHQKCYGKSTTFNKRSKPTKLS